MAYIQSQYLVAAFVCFVLSSLIFSVFFDPLRKIPGPFWAKRTNLWKTWHTYRGDLHDIVVKLHKKCGPAIRIGPGDVNFQSREAVDAIYKSGRTMPKTAYYDGFVPAGRANLFTTRDESFHALRRRQMAHSFSTATLLQFEGTFNKHLDRLFVNIEHSVGTTFDMKELVACYTYDVICELAFDRDVNTQAAPSKASLPPIPDHIFLGALYGHMSSLLPYSMKLGDKLPIGGLQKLLASRRQLAQQTGEWVRSAMETHNKGDRETLLANIFEAQDPETGARLTIDEICAEAFAFLVAGAHTSSATLGFLFYHLMHNQDAAEKLTAELRDHLPLYHDGGQDIPYAGLERKLPYTMACIKENFRISAVFTMPLPRLVTDPKGVDICGYHVPQGTSVTAINHALHHDPHFWGPDHDKYIPERWLEKDISFNDIMPFGIGHRACIGRNIANINILKVVSTLMRNFEFTPVDRDEILQTESSGVGEKKGPLMCTVRRRDS